jgi:hypothetical protein
MRHDPSWGVSPGQSPASGQQLRPFPGWSRSAIRRRGIASIPVTVLAQGWMHIGKYRAS